MKSAAVYIRVSTDDQTEHSPDSQLEEAKVYANTHGMIIDPKHIYTDAGISGRHAKKRPAFQNMIAAAKSKPSPFDVVLVWKFSRFARNQEESVVYKSLLRKECNVEVISITEETGDNLFGSLIERIIEWMDEYYSIRLGEEVTAKMTYAATKGVVQTAPPFGYAKEAGQPMAIKPEEACWVRFMFQQFASGVSVLQIVRKLNEAGVLTKKGNRFENRSVEYILHNPIYIGYTRWTPEGQTVGRRIYDSPDTITARGDFQPIVDEVLFNQVHEKLAAKKLLSVTNGKKNAEKYAKPVTVKKHWLSGLVKCGNCGASLVYSSANGGFQCHRYAHGFCGVSHYIKASKLEAAVITSLEEQGQRAAKAARCDAAAILKGDYALEEKHRAACEAIEKIIFTRPGGTIEIFHVQ